MDISISIVQLITRSMSKLDVDIILGLTSMEKLGTFILNMNQFFTFSYKGKETL